MNRFNKGKGIIMSGIVVKFENVCYFVTNCHVNRNTDGTCTATAVIKGKEISVSYTASAVNAMTNETTSGKPWLYQVRRDLVRAYIAGFGKPVETEDDCEREREPLTVNDAFLQRIKETGLEVSVRRNTFYISLADFIIAKGSLGRTRQIKIVNDLTDKRELIDRIQRERREIEDFFATFSIA